MSTNPMRKTRLTARVDPETHQRIVHAAELSGQSMNQFLVDAATKTAKETIQKATTIKLTEEEADRMLELLDNPRPMNPRLREAALRHLDIKHHFESSRKSK